MDKLIKKIDYEKLLYIFIIISPFLDVISFIFRGFFPNVTLSPATILRPIIPIILLLIIFIKEKNKRLILLGTGTIYIIYGIIHMLIFKTLHVTSSYGSFGHELQYIINYTYIIALLITLYYVYKNYNLSKLPKVLSIALVCYLALIYLSIITNTSSNTYIEGIGYKGWFASGNAIGSILLLLFCVYLPNTKFMKNKIWYVIIIVLLGAFMMFLLGTRVGLYGFGLCLLVFLLTNIFVRYIKKTKITNHRLEILVLAGIVIGFTGIALIGSNTLNRQKNLDNMSNNIIDPNTGKPSHVTGDALKIVNDIKAGNIEYSYMSKAQQTSMLDLYNYANKNNLSMTNRRQLQLIYHYNLVKNQNNIIYILFGNGYLTNYAEMTLEMELVSIVVNFGIVGFSLYLGPLLLILFKAIKFFFTRIKAVDSEFIMYLFAATLAYILSLLAGYTFFNPSSTIIIIAIHIMLLFKIRELEKI